MKILYLLLIAVSFCVNGNTPIIYHPSNLKILENENIRTIAQDNLEILWFGTSEGLYKYDGYNLDKISIPGFHGNILIQRIIIDSNGVVWIGVNKLGLLKVQNDTLEVIPIAKNNQNITVLDIVEDKDNNLWIATDKGLKFFSPHNTKHIYSSVFNKLDSKVISSIELSDKNQLIIASSGMLEIIDLSFNKIDAIYLSNPELTIHDLLQDKDNRLWIATENGLQVLNLTNYEFLASPLPALKNRVFNIVAYKEFLYVTTIGNGIYQINLENENIKNYQYETGFENSLKENNIISLFISKKGILWLGYFHKGIGKILLNDLPYTHESNTKDGFYCSKKTSLLSGYKDEKGTMWLGTLNGIIKQTKDDCYFIGFRSNELGKLSNTRSIIKIKNKIWFLTNDFIAYIDNKNNDIKKLDISIPKNSKFIVPTVDEDGIYIGSSQGLYLYMFDSLNNTKVNSDSSLSNAKINGYFFDKDEGIIFATSKGISTIDGTGALTNSKKINNKLPSREIDAIYKHQDKYYLSIKNIGLFTLDKNLNLLKLISFKLKIYNINVTNSNIWLGTNKGVVLHNQEYGTKIFPEFKGIYNQVITSNLFQPLTKAQELIYTGSNGFIRIEPGSFKINAFDSNIILSKLFILNKDVKKNTITESGFYLEAPINQLKLLELSYKDYIIGFEFAALDYADSMRNKYAYRLKGFQDDWVHTDAKNRQATYTNLKPGDYTFQVKASNKNGVWSDKPKELKIIVHPAWWFSTWAYIAYLLITIISLWCFIRYRTTASRKRADLLETTVIERTAEVNRQKKMVESLLDHKNEVFANVTHEFKTPLSLILGPTEQLVAEADLSRHSDKLEMIQRNAKRLILMVGQILKLSQAENDKEVIRESQAVQSILLMLHESFAPLAHDKDITLDITNNYDVNVYATADCLEVVIGNLLSNALKYTNTGGEISIYSELKDKQISISVKDSGSGIEAKDIDKIFKRFTRLDTHKNIAGTGIGLSVVKEISEANDGFVNVESKWGKGSVFTVTFPITDIKADEEMSQMMVDQLVQNTANEIINEQQLPQAKILKNRISVLIIEDNIDMQTHIISVLNHRFNCLFADRGRKGIAIALKELPDIVICDVMMPGMDGYQVTRILRHDGRTSHIPIILLTALNTTQSRIKGWRENVDSYMTKPFNADELNIQIDNILTIRKMLQKKIHKAIRSNSPVDALNLSKQDKKFIEKFKDVIGKYYSNEYFQKADLAAKMAVSERQLQRKLKALIDQNPIDMLRDYRLEKATMKLKDGYQVGTVSDECGFSSVSYFGSCFKKKYGITPKAYQTLNKN